MGPTELTISGFIALAAVLPISAMMESKTPGLATKNNLMSDYVVKSDCVGIDGSVGPCVISPITGQQLGLDDQKIY